MADDTSKRVPRILGRYALYEKIAAGGMASVHLARLLGPVGFSRTVAIKRLHPHYASDAEFVSMLLDEARVAARIRHPNVVPTLDVVADAGELFVVMEYVLGESLNRLLKTVATEGGFVPPRIASAIGCDLLHGLSAAHEAKGEKGEPLGIVHRDVSPQNVIVGVDGVARVLDFGIAKAVSRLQTTREGQLKGKLAYMSPEQVIGLETDPRTDIYAASVVLWEMLTARRLFLADNDGELLAKVHAAVAAPPSERMPEAARAELPPETLERLDGIVLRGLARNVEERFQTARAMVDALEDCLSPAPKGQVGAWVERTATSALNVRSVNLADIESDTSLTPTPRPSELMSAIKVSPSSAPRVTEEASPVRIEPPSTAPNMALAPPLGSGPKIPRAGRALLLLVAALVGVVVTVQFFRGRTQAENTPGAIPSPHALTDFPAPSSPSPEALAAYRDGLQGLRDASVVPALASFERAVSLDPGLAAAHLRRAAFNSLYAGNDIATHESFSRAVQQRAHLSERDQALLDALEPYLSRDPSDLAEAERRTTAVSDRNPADAEMAFYAALFHYARGDHAAARDVFERAVADDPKFALALAYEVGARAYVGDLAGARNTVDRCLAASPLGTQCLFFRMLLDAELGDCRGEEAVAKEWIARDPNDYYAYQVLALALAAEGRSAEAVRAALDQKWAKSSSPSKKWREPMERARLDLLVGDFDAAEVRLRAIVDSPSASDTSMLSHAAPAALLIGLYRETDRLPLAQKVAEQFLRQSDVWSMPHLADDVVISAEAVPLALATLRDAGALNTAAFEEGRREWLERWHARASGIYARYLWIYGYAWQAETPEQARAALAALPDYAPVPTFSPQAVGAVYVGRTYLLAGRVDEAVATLQKATTSCTVLQQPVEHTRGLADLGTALESQSDVLGACAAYRAVLARWRDPKPRSLTATKVRGRMTALKCPEGGP